MLVTTKSKAKLHHNKCIKIEKVVVKRTNIKANQSLNVPDHFKFLSLICCSSEQSLVNVKRKKH